MFERLRRPLVLILAAIVPLLARPASAADVAPARAEEVTYTSGDVPLAATLLLPPGPGPFPGAVLVHGSGTSSRSNAWTSAYAEALVARGVAVLHPDKRGSGASGGDWRSATFVDLADDTVAGVRVLRDHAAVDAALVGVIGFSQGGYVVAVAAARSAEVAFAIDVSGSVVPMVEQIGDEIRLMGTREGLTADQLAAVATIHREGARYALRGGPWDAYAGALAAAKAGPIGTTEVVRGFPATPDSPKWGFLKTIGDFDPLPYWREVEVPVLFLYGGRDENVDVFRSADVIERELTPAGLPYSLLLFRNNGHALFRDDAMDFVARWIRDRGAD
jgi:dipeptidyl aminopeptidase/acylaminoacyl peptidase